ncbi:hypothetical protein FQR65_LT17366 [Abscondita terminalis]|nr:hypothetical protein FQR65_LT17366 [Abscondita terminalis]
MVQNTKDLADAIEKAYKEDNEIIIESYLKGTEVSVGVINYKGETVVLPITEIVSDNEFFDFEAKYQDPKNAASRKILITTNSEQESSLILMVTSENLNLTEIIKNATMTKKASNKNLSFDSDFLDKLVVGIGEVSQITGIPARQIRYWEEKGIIASLTEEEANDGPALFLLCTASFSNNGHFNYCVAITGNKKTDLGYSQPDYNGLYAYVILFGGFLLLGAGLSDLSSAKNFIVGFVILTLASLLAGVAWSEASLNIGRALQGIGSAFIAPAALTLVLSKFTDPNELNKALGFWGASAAAGGSGRVFLGGYYRMAFMPLIVLDQYSGCIIVFALEVVACCLPVKPEKEK